MNNDKSIKAKTYKNKKKVLGGYLGQGCGYKIDARVVKAAKMINNSCPNCCSCCFQCDSYQRIDHCLVRTSNNPSVDNRINNIVKGYKSRNNMRINSISNIDILGNKKIVNRQPIFIYSINKFQKPNLLFKRNVHVKLYTQLYFDKGERKHLMEQQQQLLQKIQLKGTTYSTTLWGWLLDLLDRYKSIPF
ncbi:hypothetical protein BCR32DRAFT_284810 [Anaeromyces robustus]|uniref:Uncharacterized protein n=1 Tax=Anaeromyces robustus TaxID=1754192 RepID=A0A1Y1WRA6_9FUNG|nr:hypothetical protein BCR32DRAFT_284810 [Anaeromyces robustus]|eukprot:ORX75818.1 hypothetical protein BCR32DRAFT_284810 [Anaeromyces robustus]